MKNYTPLEVRKITGTATRRIQQLVEAELVTAESPGQGVKREFKPEHFFEILLAELLAARGVRLSRIKKIFKMARKTWPEMFDLKTYSKNGDTFGLVVYADRVFFGKTVPTEGKDLDGFILVDMRVFDAAIVVNVSRIYDKVKHL